MDKIERLREKARENKLTAVMYEDALRDVLKACTSGDNEAIAYAANAGLPLLARG